MRCAACHCLSNATALELYTHLSLRATPATQVQKRHILSYIKQYQNEAHTQGDSFLRQATYSTPVRVPGRKYRIYKKSSLS